MTNLAERPFQGKTDGELFLISEFLEREIQTLREKNLAIRAEMRLRDGSKDSVAAVLKHEREEALDNRRGAIGDRYADRSKRYAIQISLVAIAIAIAIFIGLVLTT